jgi:hypothetical protein
MLPCLHEFVLVHHVEVTVFVYPLLVRMAVQCYSNQPCFPSCPGARCGAVLRALCGLQQAAGRVGHRGQAGHQED